MDQIIPDATPMAAATGGATTSSDPILSSAPLSSGLSDPPATDAPDSAPHTSPGKPAGALESSVAAAPYSAQTEEIVKRIKINAANAAATGTPGWEAAREQIMRGYPTTEKLATPDAARELSVLERGDRESAGPASTATGDSIAVKMDGNGSTTTPGSASRGSTRGRPRGRGRGGGRGGKRKREHKADGGGDSDSSEVYTPAATKTKSGRSVQKPTAFVPPPQPSPTSTGNKRRRSYRRNPESAVCKMCLRGTSPASNMIVFCDGCNTPYHRYCHHPPIDQSVVDEMDKEWYCKQCEKERVVPVPDAEVAEFIAASGTSVEQRQRYFGSLPQGMLVTLLTKATTLHPDLPLFANDFHARAAAGPTSAPPAAHPPTNGQSYPIQPPANSASSNPPFPGLSAAQATPGAAVVVAPELPVPEEHPPNYPRPGHGLMKTLPPEQEDLQWLVDDDDRYGVFSHMYQVDPQAANAGMNGGGNAS